MRQNVFMDRVSACDPAGRARHAERAHVAKFFLVDTNVLFGPSRSGHLLACGFMLAPMAFQAEWPPSMNFASNPRSRSAIAIWHPT